jgi:LysM repeat protein
MKRYLFFLYFLLFCSFYALGQTWNKAYQDYFDQYKDIAIQQMRQYGIPASITLAQGALESGAGKSELTRRSNNHFGIKCNGWTGRKSYHDDDELGECFRAYNNAYESYVDHSVFLSKSPRYSRLFQLKQTDYKGWARGLKACGYATSPTYATKLIGIIELYGLDRYDSGKSHWHGIKLEALQGLSNRQIQAFNNNYYLYARSGDTYRSIAQDVGVSYRKLARYNERDKNDVLEEGEIVWLKKKRSKAPKQYKGYIHRVAGGESMYTISQKYGIRLKYLYKMNHLTADYQIQVGDMLRVR